MLAVVYDVQSPILMAVAEELENKGWKVLKKVYGEETCCELEAIDMLVMGVDTAAAPTDENADQIGQFAADRMFGIHRLAESHVPALEKGQLKRIAVITEEESGIRLCRETEGYAKHMLHAGIHMKLKMLFNKYRQQGWTFRCFAVPAAEMREGMWKQGEGLSPVDYICLNFSDDPREVFMHNEENNFVRRNKWFEEVEW